MSETVERLKCGECAAVERHPEMGNWCWAGTAGEACIEGPYAPCQHKLATMMKQRDRLNKVIEARLARGEQP